MSVEILIQVLIAVSTIVGGAVAAYATYRSTNSSVKNEDIRTTLDIARLQKEIGAGGVEDAERISNISLANAQFMQTQYMDCVNNIRDLKQENQTLGLKVSQLNIKMLKIVSKLRRIINDHEDLFEEQGQSCPGFQTLQNQILQIIEETEEEFV